MTLRNKIIDGIIDREGGYSDNKNDSGGKTNYGITEAVARDWGYTGDMRKLPRDIAVQIYENRFWYSLRLDEIEALSLDIAEEVADTGVNMGVMRAGKFLQQALNVFNLRGAYYDDLVVDGMVGRKTITAMTSFMRRRGKNGEVVLLRALNSLQGEFYINLTERRQKDEDFVYGWFLNRVS